VTKTVYIRKNSRVNVWIHAMVPTGKHINEPLRTKHCWCTNTETHIYKRKKLSVTDGWNEILSASHNFGHATAEHAASYCSFLAQLATGYPKTLYDHIGHYCELSYFRAFHNLTSDFRIRFYEVPLFASFLLFVAFHKQCYTFHHFYDHWHERDNVATWLTSSEDIEIYLTQFHCS
jgi:hypothetical protein